VAVSAATAATQVSRLDWELLVSLIRRAKKRDATEQSIVEALRDVGCHILRLDSFDLLVLRGSKLYMLECKSDSGILTDSQQYLIDAGWPLHVCYDADDALKAVGLIK